MKTTMEFTFPEDADAFNDALAGEGIALAVTKWLVWARGQIKYNPDHMSGEQVDAIENARDKLLEELRDRDVSIEVWG